MYERFLKIYRNPIHADSILQKLVGALWKDKLNSDGIFEFTGETFSYEYKNILEQIADTDTLSFEYTDEPNLEHEEISDARMMVKQLESIKVVPKEGTQKNFLLAYYLRKYFRLKNLLKQCYDTNLITVRSENDYDRVAKESWRNIMVTHQQDLILRSSEHEDIDEAEKIKIGKDTLNDAMNTEFKMYGRLVDKEVASSWYLKLSNLNPPKVVWHIDWFNKYINKE